MSAENCSDLRCCFGVCQFSDAVSFFVSQRLDIFHNYLKFVCREFARDFPVTATALRLGRVVTEEEVEGLPDSMWLDRRDAAQAFRLALGRERSDDLRFTARWALYHICADIPNPRFLIDSAKTTIGFRPEHNFQKQWGEPRTSTK